MTHMCVKKERDQEKDVKHVRHGFEVYRRFYERNQPRYPKSWNDFINSQFYNDFIKVGRFIVDTNPINSSQFVDFLITSTLPVREWTSRKVYETYVRELTKKETPDAAVERNILLMQQWAASTGEHWTDFFRKVSPAQATMWIKSGRVSPWVIYICESSEDLLSRLSPEQFAMIETCLDPGFWRLKMDKYPEDVAFFRQTFRDAGV